MSDRHHSVHIMGNSPVDPAPYAQALRAADPRLREPPAGSLAPSQPSCLDTLREARFAAYRRRAEVRPPAEILGSRSAREAEVSRRGAAAAREALRQHRQAS
jgi:hypothetical protein